MRTAGSNAFGQRDIVVVVVIVDEAHGLADWAETYATIELGPDLPTWDARPAPAIDTLGDAVDYAETIATAITRWTTPGADPGDVRGARPGQARPGQISRARGSARLGSGSGSEGADGVGQRRRQHQQRQEDREHALAVHAPIHALARLERWGVDAGASRRVL